MEKATKDMQNNDKRLQTELYGSEEGQREMLKAVKAANEKGALAYLFNEVKALRAQLETKTE